MPDPPTAILTANGYLLGMVSLDLLQLGVQIGKEIVLASMDKDDPGRPIEFWFTQLQLPSYEMGCQTMRMLLNRLQNSTPASTTLRACGQTLSTFLIRD